MMKLRNKRVLLGAVSLVWLSYSWLLYGQTPLSPIITTTILAGVAGLFYAITAYAGPSKLSSIFGKILIIVGVISIITLLLDEGISASVDTITRLLVVISGLLLERLSPHQRLYNWMFLMIATKVEAVLIATLISQAERTILATFPLHSWWLVVALMLVGVPLLAFKQKLIYRIFVILTTITAVVLAFDIITVQAQLVSPIVYIAVGAALWPIVTQRLIGYRVFYTRKSN